MSTFHVRIINLISETTNCKVFYNSGDGEKELPSQKCTDELPLNDKQMEIRLETDLNKDKFYIQYFMPEERIPYPMSSYKKDYSNIQLGIECDLEKQVWRLENRSPNGFKQKQTPAKGDPTVNVAIGENENKNPVVIG